MKIKILLTSLVLVFSFQPLTSQAAITWGESITAGSTTLKASHMNEIRAQIEALRTDVDAGVAGAWDTATGGINYAGGNVGIGTTSPGAKLDVQGSVKVDGTAFDFWFDNTNDLTNAVDTTWRITRNDGAGNWHNYINSNGGTSPTRQTEGSAYHEKFSPYDANYYIQGAGSGVSGSAISWQNIMTLNLDNGNVGIGTTNPSAKLDVNGNARLRGNTYIGEVADNRGVLSHSPNIGGGEPGVILQGDTGKGVLLRGDAGATVGMIIRASGKVGIGTNSPAYVLDVNGNIRTKAGRSLIFGTGEQKIYGDNGSAFYVESSHDTVTQMLFRDKQDTVYGRVYGSGNGANFGLLDGDGNWSYLAVKDNYTAFRINNNEKMRILANGNVGIGTTSPLDELHVVSASGASKIRINSGDGSNFILKSWVDGGVSKSTLGAGITPNVITFRNDNGNVGIGTTSPEAKLHIVGDTRIDNSAGGDFQVRDSSKGSSNNVIWYDYSSGRTYLGNTGGSGSDPEVTVRGDLEVTEKLLAAEYCDENGNNCGDASTGVGIHVGDTVTPASTTCVYVGVTNTLNPSDVTVVGGKFGISYIYQSAPTCNQTTCTRTYNGTWGACNCSSLENCVCFVAGTKVLMADGSEKDIEMVKIGDLVLNEFKRPTKVVALHKPIIGERGIFKINNKVEVTGDHPFKTTKGWKVADMEQYKFTIANSPAYDRMRGEVVGQLAPGDILVSANGEEVIETIVWSDERSKNETVYSFEMEEGEGYWADGYLVKDLK